jgi:hypothetical protein
VGDRISFGLCNRNVFASLGVSQQLTSSDDQKVDAPNSDEEIWGVLP